MREATRWMEKVTAETISDRRNRLMAIQKKISRENLRVEVFAEGRLPKTPHSTALVEGLRKTPLVWEARLEGMALGDRRKLYLTDIELRGGEVADIGLHRPR